MQEIINKHTKDGATDWDAVNQEIEEMQKNAIEDARKEDAKKAKPKTSANGDGDEEKGTKPKANAEDDEWKAKYDELKGDIDEFKRSGQIEKFKREAKKNNLSKEQIDVLVKTNADLTDFDFTPFKRENVDDLGNADQGGDNDKAKEEVEEKKIVDEILEMRG